MCVYCIASIAFILCCIAMCCTVSSAASGLFEKEDFLENLLVLSCFVQPESVHLFSRVLCGSALHYIAFYFILAIKGNCVVQHTDVYMV